MSGGILFANYRDSAIQLSYTKFVLTVALAYHLNVYVPCMGSVEDYCNYGAAGLE